MFAFKGMIANAAEEAGMKVPADADGKWDPKEFPHFNVFCMVQLGCAMYPGEHWNNAKVIASIPDDKIKTATVEDLIEAGYYSKGL